MTMTMSIPRLRAAARCAVTALILMMLSYSTAAAEDVTAPMLKAAVIRARNSDVSAGRR